MMNFLSALSLPFIICFFTTITAAVRHKEFLTGNISINCGSSEDFAAADGREWIGDGHEKTPSYIQIKGSSTSSSIAGESVVSADQAQYMKTARISRSSFSYTFRLSPGTKFIRLHFNPGSYRAFEGLKDLFTVEAGPFTLLGKFSASLTADALDRKEKFFAIEFCINIEEYQLFDIIFYPDRSIGSYAFINGIEPIAMPTYLSYLHTGVQGREKDGKHNLLVTVESTDELGDRNGPFKEFEILKVSNLDDSLANPNPRQLARDSPYGTMQRLLKVCGNRNVIATIAISIITIVAFKLWQLWDDNFMDEEREQCRHFSLAEIVKATGNFNHEFVIGEGGFGRVYKGVIDNRKETVAIKRLKYSSRQGAHEFSTEIKTLSKFRHVNIISLIGYCNEQKEMILVYEHMAHGKLGDHINLYKHDMGNNHHSFLSWNQCLNICIEAARGLDYLHTECKIIHRDVNTSNILLNENYVAKFSDFGLAKLENICQSQSHVSTVVKGTHGYIDPYYIKFRKLTSASDVYSFGVVLLAVLCGRPALDPRLKEDRHSLVEWARRHISKGDTEKIVSSNLIEEILPDSLNTFVRTAESCLDEEPKNRPSMTQVVSQLESALELQENPYSLKSEETSTANGSEPSSEKDRKESTSEDEVISEHDRSAIKAVVANGFSVSNRMGKGLFGTFYKVSESELVAVERVALLNQSLLSAISILHENKHPNIFNLLRNFTNESESVLEFEFTEQKSLKDAILSGKHDQLSWRHCFKIIIGVAHGINFLNQHPPLRKCYSSIDPCNIFLDAHMNPQLAIDYCGMPMKIKTRYYAPPEGYCASNIFVSDIYGFGVLVLDMLASMWNLSEKHLDPVPSVQALLVEGKLSGLVRAKLGFGFSSKEALICIKTALLCTQSDPNKRPHISKVIRLLERFQKIELDAIPLRIGDNWKKKEFYGGSGVATWSQMVRSTPLNFFKKLIICM